MLVLLDMSIVVIYSLLPDHASLLKDSIQNMAEERLAIAKSTSQTKYALSLFFFFGEQFPCL